MICSFNPYSGEKIAVYDPFSETQVKNIISKTHSAHEYWKLTPFSDRADLIKRMAELLTKRKEEFARLITIEMGKIIRESRAEIEKCAWLCSYYAENAENMLKPALITSDGQKSFVRFDPIGVIYAIMPWNYPFWQVLRATVPTIMAGNAIVLKHAPNVFGCAKAIEKLFLESGFPSNLLSNLIIDIDLSETVIAHPLVQGVTLTGSQKAGSIVASQAGKHLKKIVLELGGSDPFIVLKDADLSKACATGMLSRMQNCGQVCISAKRFIVEKPVFHQFLKDQLSLIRSLKPGDPFDEKTDLGPLARVDLIDQIDRQVNESVKMGAVIETGGMKLGTQFYSPTLLSNVSKGMPVYDEETFGPVSLVIAVNNEDEAVKVANETSFGLGASIWTKNLTLAEEMASKIDAGAVFINGITKSDPRLPFGGTKRSGFGRELSEIGIKEFTNCKTVWIA